LTARRTAEPQAAISVKHAGTALRAIAHPTMLGVAISFLLLFQPPRTSLKPMTTLLENVEFWKAISTMLWPLVVLVVFLSARSKIYAFLNRDHLTIKVAGMEIGVADAAKKPGGIGSRSAEAVGRC
jgi:hypothetical protein